MEVIRDAAPADFDRINEIYNWTIVDNHVSFDTEPWDRDRRAAWWKERDPALQFLVAEIDGTVQGLTYSSWYRPKLAYRTTAETTIVLDMDHLGIGLGTRLLTALLDRLAAQDLHMAVAIIALPNDASVALHRKLGYRSVGVLHDAGRKYGRYWDTEIFEKPLV